MSTTKQATWLPVFTGFYNSIFDESDSFIEREADLSSTEFREYYSELCDAGLTQEYFNENLYNYIDYRAGENGVAEYLCNALPSLESCNIIIDVDYESVVSPKYYNFTTDSINCEITYDVDKLMQYLKDNMAEFEAYIKSTYTSRDGFISSYSNDIEYWLDAENYGEHEIGSLLQFVLVNESDDAVMDLYYEANSGEGFSNSVNIDTERMIKDFKDKEVA